MRKLLMSLTIAGTALAAGSVLMAQNYAADPLYGTLTLTTGFTPDPQSVQVQAGGADAVSDLNIVDPTGGMCRGYINAAAPDVRVHYTAGTTYPIRFYVQSTADTTLLVNMPDASWRCSDDFAGFNPLVHVDAPPSGQYDIWIGTYSATAPAPATFYVTELATNGPTM